MSIDKYLSIRILKSDKLLAHYYLGLALYKQNLSDKATGCWKRAAKAEPGSDAALKAQKKLEFVRKHMNQVIDQLESQIRQE